MEEKKDIGKYVTVHDRFETVTKMTEENYSKITGFGYTLSSNEELEKRIEELEKENRELMNQINELSELCHKERSKNMDLKQRIETASKFIKEKRATTPGLGAITAILNF
jgi:predicted  nucleic acid-binding Zn-ribbon protein